MKILITGAESQLGQELRNVLESRMPGSSTYIDQQDVDLTDVPTLKQYLNRNRFTHVVNCASYPSIDKAEEESGKCSAINTDIIRNLATYADEYGYKIIQMSSDLVFDGMTHKPYTESDKVCPTSQYGATKRKGETALLALAPDSIIIRAGWIFSPYGDNFVKRMLNTVRTDKSVNVVADQIGSPTYALDLAEAIYVILNAQQWVPGVFNYANEGVATKYDFAKAIVRIAGYRGCTINPILAIDRPTAAPRPYYSVLNKSRIKATYGIQIPHWEESLAQCIERIGRC